MDALAPDTWPGDSAYRQVSKYRKRHREWLYVCRHLAKCHYTIRVYPDGECPNSCQRHGQWHPCIQWPGRHFVGLSCFGTVADGPIVGTGTSGSLFAWINNSLAFSASGVNTQGPAGANIAFCGPLLNNNDGVFTAIDDLSPRTFTGSPSTAAPFGSICGSMGPRV
jgi:hypothetical protein